MTLLDNGHRYEAEVTADLQARGWRVQPFGQGLLSPLTRAWLGRSVYPVRWLPDLIAARRDALAFIDAKRSLRVDRHAVEELAVRSAIGFEAWNHLAEFYVFPDGCVARPATVRAYGVQGVAERTRASTGKPFLLISCTDCRHVDEVFGKRHP